MKNVVNDIGVVNDGVVDVCVGSLVHLLVASEHDVEGVSQGNVDSAFEVLEDVVFAQNFVGRVQGDHD